MTVFETFMPSPEQHATARAILQDRREADSIVGGVPAVDILRRGLEDLAELCDIITRKFTKSRDDFNKERTDDMETD